MNPFLKQGDGKAQRFFTARHPGRRGLGEGSSFIGGADFEEEDE